jgi:stage V sporulation protein G
MLNITDTRVRLIENSDSQLKAIASIVIDGCFAIHDIKIIEGKDGVFIAMPSRKTAEGNFKDIAHPINSEARAMVKEAIIERYQKALEEV